MGVMTMPLSTVGVATSPGLALRLLRGPRLCYSSVDPVLIRPGYHSLCLTMLPTLDTHYLWFSTSCFSGWEQINKGGHLHQGEEPRMGSRNTHLIRISIRFTSLLPVQLWDILSLKLDLGKYNCLTERIPCIKKLLICRRGFKRFNLQGPIFVTDHPNYLYRGSNWVGNLREDTVAL
ncbi:hypothetical protein EV401DRAFT_946419 [Pisolithus croceorrhizus]|nr:hypothetical protein EV401DRAFT_946419 [Pisolithus croceorrhizus]